MRIGPRRKVLYASLATLIQIKCNIRITVIVIIIIIIIIKKVLTVLQRKIQIKAMMVLTIFIDETDSGDSINDNWSSYRFFVQKGHS